MADDGSGAPRDYKDTLTLPRTDFPMKGNLLQLEPRMLGFWEEQRIYERMLELNAAGPRFVFHDGPPYANGRLHAGHALNKTLKDIVVKFRNQTGESCVYVPGWDCHGLPIEQAAEKRLREQKVDRRSLSREEFLEHCRAYAQEFIAIQREEMRRLGIFARWEAPYRTLDFGYEAQELRELAIIARRGLLYRRKKPVYWCTVDQTALAEAEVEYEDHHSPSVYVGFPALLDRAARDGRTLAARLPALAARAVELVIWTTTPWTLPANLAVAVHPELEYVFYDLDTRVICVAKDLLPRVLGEIAPAELAVLTVGLGAEPVEAAALVQPARILGFLSGADLEGLAYRHPFIAREGTVVLAPHVTLEQGTGLVHTAPGHGQEDYEVGILYGLEIYNPVQNDGRYDQTVEPPSLRGMRIFEANPVIVELLAQRGALLNRPGEQVKHSYPHCWRCHSPIIFRATHQWFIALDRPMDATAGLDATLRSRALAEIDGAVQWIPEWGKARIRGMLENRPDWCISRQRTWGVPIPVALCEECGEALVSPEMIDRVADAVADEGVGVWYRTPVEQFLAPGTSCPCGSSRWRREMDILDVWFDSACSFAAVLERRPGLGFPADLYLEGSDQHRGWFHSSLLVATATRGRAPYRSVLTHGFVVDGEGRKMSKSLGNVLPLERMVSQYGAEVVRLWVASSDYRDDVRLSDPILRSLSEGYRKIRNTVRYALGNLADFDPGADAVPADRMLPLDVWALSRLSDLVSRVRRAYRSCEFHLVFHAVVELCGHDLSAVYYDISKDRLYTWKATGTPRRSAQTVLHRLVTDLLRLLAPVMSFTAEEAWAHLPGPRADSVFLAGFPESSPAGPPRLLADFEQLFAVRAAVQKQLEGARRDKVIGASLESKVLLHASGPAGAFLEEHLADLPMLFIVSQVDLVDALTPRMQRTSGVFPAGGALGVEILPADGAKCPRCWTYAKEVAAGDPVCAKCQAAL